MMFSSNANAQNVNIPDAAFKAKLVNNPAINTNGDGEIQVDEAAAFNGFLNVQAIPYQPLIQNLTGIEAFTALTGLNCSGHLYIYSLNVTANTALTYLSCWGLSLSNLNVSNNTALTYLNCENNNIASLNVAANTALTDLNCSDNNLTSLNVSANTALTSLQCEINNLSSLDVTANTALTTLACYTNQLTSLNVTANTALTYLGCAYNQLTSLNVAANAALTNLTCSHNQFTSLNIQNGNNANLTLDAEVNPGLTCIQVDNVANANSYNGVTFFKDAAASYSTDCGISSVPVIDNLATVQIFPNPASSHLTIALGNNNKKVIITIVDITGKIIYATTASDTQKTEVFTNDFATGVYAIHIQTPDFMVTKKLVIEK